MSIHRGQYFDKYSAPTNQEVLCLIDTESVLAPTQHARSQIFHTASEHSHYSSVKTPVNNETTRTNRHEAAEAEKKEGCTPERLYHHLGFADSCLMPFAASSSNLIEVQGGKWM